MGFSIKISGGGGGGRGMQEFITVLKASIPAKLELVAINY